ncbi:MAG: DUF2141 domain-containing protein [Pseudomonadota bacterium]
MKNRFKRLRFSVMFIATLVGTSATGQGLNITIDGLRNDKGEVLVFVFDRARPFERLNVWGAAHFAQIKASAGQIEVTFESLNQGPYAVFLFHDENSDEDLNASDTALFEGVGATGAPRPDDDPNFAQASVMPGDVTVQVHYDQ